MRVGFEYSVDDERILADILRKYFQICQNHSLLTSVHVRADGLRSVFTYLGILLDVPLPVEAMLPERTGIRVGLVISFAVRTFEGMRARFALFCFKSRRISFSVHFTTPTEFPMMFRFVRPIAFDAFGSLDTARVSGMSPFPAVFTLGDSRIHVRSSDYSDIVAHVEASVNEELSILPALHVPNVNPNYGHIGFWRDFDNPWFGCEGYVVENVILLENSFNVGRGKLLLRVRVRVEWNSYDFQV